MKRKSLRNRLGSLKYKAIDCWPYFLHVKKASYLRQQYQKMLLNLPPAEKHSDLCIEVHMLCGKRHMDMGIWASWSLMRFFSGVSLYVHSDGSLNEEDIDQWKKIIPMLTLIKREEADEKAKTVLKDRYPHIARWRKADWCGCYLVDFHLFGSSKQIIILDADVLCFNDPLLLKQNISDDISCWNKDITNAYAAPPEEINRLLSITLPDRFNAGFCMISRIAHDDFDFLESVINTFEDSKTIDVDHLWSSQTYLAAILANRRTPSNPLPSEYDITRGQKNHSCVIRHYVGIPSIRPRYFLEGIPCLLSQIGLKAQP
jgi:hypothetical protein